MMSNYDYSWLYNDDLIMNDWWWLRILNGNGKDKTLTTNGFVHHTDHSICIWSRWAMAGIPFVMRLLRSDWHQPCWEFPPKALIKADLLRGIVIMRIDDYHHHHHDYGNPVHRSIDTAWVSRGMGSGSGCVGGHSQSSSSSRSST